jgi:hypothetical protein
LETKKKIAVLALLSQHVERNQIFEHFEAASTCHGIYAEYGKWRPPQLWIRPLTAFGAIRAASVFAKAYSCQTSPSQPKPHAWRRIRPTVYLNV